MESLKKIYPNVVVPQHGRGYFGVGILCPKITKNIGTLWRTAQIFGADFMFIIGKRYETFRSSLHKGSKLVGIELDEQSVPLASYSHPQRAVYLLGAEDFGLPPEVIATCDDIVQIPGESSLNVSVAGSIVIYDRLLKRGGFGVTSLEQSI